MKSLFSLAFFHLLALSSVPLIAYDEEELIYLEEQIPELAMIALRTAYWEALASGSCVLVVKNRALVEVAPDGSERIIKEWPNWIPVAPGKHMRISIETEEEMQYTPRD